MKELDRIWGKVKDRYSLKQQQFRGQFEFGVAPHEHGGPKTSVASAAEQIGFVFKSSNDWVFQATLDSFSYSQVGAYTGWEPFIAEAKILWSIYATVVKIKRAKRLALRYINKFDIPQATINLKHYFRTGPEIAPELPQTLAGFFMQSQLPLPEAEAVVLINQTQVPPDKKDHLSLLLDIDLFRLQNLGRTDEEMWATFEQLRVWKNRVFEACITDNTRELIR